MVAAIILSFGAGFIFGIGVLIALAFWWDKKHNKNYNKNYNKNEFS